ncbi:MAG: dihydrodipicolinate synthase family protein, partial [Bacillota bacterium]|nr:dihydrodipicolinate synthase family protein [Bacillota bacterium]
MFSGVFCPSITIIDENENIDYEAWGKHLDHIADAGINGVLLFGSIGEFFAVSVADKKKAIKFAKDRVGDRMKVFFGIGDTNLDNVIELAKYGEHIGVDAVVAVSPYYFGPSDTT